MINALLWVIGTDRSLEDDDFNRAFPAPRLADFIRAAADSRRSVSV